MPTARHRALTIRGHLVVLFVAFVVALVVVTEFQGSRQVDQARDDGRALAQFMADLGAETTAEAIGSAREQADALAANPGVATAFDVADGCTLTASPVPPFGAGHLDIVASDGTVVCSSQELPPPRRYEGATWLEPDSGPVTILTTEPDSDVEVLVLTAPIADRGAVAVFMELTGMGSALADRYGGDDEQFGVRDADGRWLTDPLPASGMLQGSSEVDAVGWVVHAAIPEEVATASAGRALDQSRFVALLGALVLLVAVIVLNRLLVRPVRRLDDEVARAMVGEVPRPVESSGPREVVALAENFSTLARNVATELDQRRSAEDEARRSASSIRQLFEANPQPTWVHDRDTGEILMANDALVETIGISRDELVGSHVRRILPEEAPAWLGRPDDQAEALHRVGPWRFHISDDEDIDCEVTSDVLDVDGRRGRLVIIEDVTTSRRTQRMVNEMQRMDSLGQLAGGIAHDFNNLLTVIINYVQLAADRLEQSADRSDAASVAADDARRDLDHVAGAATRAASLTAQLLSFAKGESIEMQPVDINEVVTEISGLLGRTLGEHITISTRLGSGLPPVLGNPAQLEQVLVNLAVNARDAMPSGGELIVETTAMEIDDDERPGLAAGTYVRIRVSDTGVGMDPTVRSRAFEPFFTTKPRGAGTGLGLSTVYGIITRGGGAMELYSELGHGTTVGVLLPATQRVAIGTATSETSTPTGDGGLVLVVEDEESLRMVTERILLRGGYQVETVPDGATALARLDAAGPGVDLVLTDAVMPGMLGVELVREVHRRHPGVPIVMMSGHLPPSLDPASDETRAPVPLLSKPFTAAELLQFVRAGLAS